MYNDRRRFAAIAFSIVAAVDAVLLAVVVSRGGPPAVVTGAIRPASQSGQFSVTWPPNTNTSTSIHPAVTLPG